MTHHGSRILTPRGGALSSSLVCCMAKAKKSKPRERLLRWRMSLITKTPGKFVDFTLALDAETAEKQVAEAHDISETLRNRLVAIREEL
jgi:hypothetical protein